MTPVGVVLAGGRGSRIGGDKALVELRGRPLLHYPLAALAAVTGRQAVVAKAASRLPALPAGVERWAEPDAPRHPLTGVLAALRQAGGEAVLCCAGDLPRLDAATLLLLLHAPARPAPCVVPEADGRLEPLCVLWRPEALGLLEALPTGLAMREVVAAIGAVVVQAPDAGVFANVNTAEDLERLSRR